MYTFEFMQIDNLYTLHLFTLFSVFCLLVYFCLVTTDNVITTLVFSVVLGGIFLTKADNVLPKEKYSYKLVSINENMNRAVCITTQQYEKLKAYQTISESELTVETVEKVFDDKIENIFKVYNNYCK